MVENEDVSFRIEEKKKHDSQSPEALGQALGLAQTGEVTKAVELLLGLFVPSFLSKAV